MRTFTLHDGTYTAPPYVLERNRSPAMPFEAYRVWVDGLLVGSIVRRLGLWSGMRKSDSEATTFPSKEAAAEYAAGMS